MARSFGGGPPARQDGVNADRFGHAPWHSDAMTGATNKARSFLASVVGYVLVALVAFWLLGAVLGTVRFLLRAVLILLVLGGLATLYVKLKGPGPD